jgi:hypothetical protein
VINRTATLLESGSLKSGAVVMGYLNAEYGSELHLLRMLGRHREFFGRKVLEATAADEVDWLNFPSGEKCVVKDERQGKQERTLWDREWRQLDFLPLPPDHQARQAWSAAWPTHRQAQNWDAVGRIRFGDKWEWLLVEAKANLEEIDSMCGAQDPKSVALITKTLDTTKAALGGASAADWTRPFCHRLALLNVLHDSGVCARLLYVYFCGDVQKGRHCPGDKEGWLDALDKQDAHLGLAENHKLKDRIHKCFVHVACPA